jgi:hypothetical protein
MALTPLKGLGKIVCALPKAGRETDAYRVFEAMVQSGDIPNAVSSATKTFFMADIPVWLDTF